MIKLALSILSKIAIGTSTASLIVTAISMVIIILIAVIYKLSSNHINHLTTSINNLNITLKDSSKEIKDTVDNLNIMSRKEHAEILSQVSRLMGRTD